MIDYPSALDKILNSCGTNHTVQAELADSFNKIAASTIKSSILLPMFTNYAMDGYAVRSNEVADASSSTPIFLTVQDNIVAGDVLSSQYINTRQIAIGINTGAPLPESFDAVIKLEDIQKTKLPGNDKESIKITSAIKPNTNIRFIGEDFSKNDIIINKGEIISPNKTMALSAHGVTELKIYMEPRISIMSTGKELSESALEKKSKIFDSNRPYLESFIKHLGLKGDFLGHAMDDENTFVRLIDKIQVEKSNIVITTGAVSCGTKDFIPKAVALINGEVIFHKVKIKPGKPMFYAILEDGSYFFGLPGNPIAVAVGMRFFVYPLIRKLQGLPRERPAFAKLVNNLETKNDFTQFHKAYAFISNNNEIKVQVLSGQESFKMKSLLKANCWIVTSECQESLRCDEMVRIYPSIPNHMFDCLIEEEYV